MVSAVLRFPGEQLAMFTCSFGAADVSRYTLLGTEGLIRLDPAYEYSQVIRLEVTIAGKKTTRSFPKRDQFAAELSYFSNCILRNKQPEPSGLEGLADVRIIEAIYPSIHTRRTVVIPQMNIEKRPSVEQEVHRPAHRKPKVFGAHPSSRDVA